MKVQSIKDKFREEMCLNFAISRSSFSFAFESAYGVFFLFFFLFKKLLDYVT